MRVDVRVLAVRVIGSVNDLVVCVSECGLRVAVRVVIAGVSVVWWAVFRPCC